MIPIPGAFFVVIFPMARLSRMVVAGLPHHVTQRGNRREPIFFEDGDQEFRDIRRYPLSIPALKPVTGGR